ncbi:MAG: hypothetical protein SGCHY_001118 [Lobulomycetales sp.]
MSLAIIGAGPGGLVALKEALETKFFTSVTVLEKKDTVGGQWSRDISVYPDLRLNTSRLLSGYSDFPIQESAEEYLTFGEYSAYISNYAKNFDLERHVTFSATVIDVTPAHDSVGAYGWKVTWETQSIRKTQIFHWVICASGAFSIPKPLVLNGFTGTHAHSSDFDKVKNESGTVLIVGAGSTALDIASLLAKSAKVTLSVRSESLVVPRWIDSLNSDGLAGIRDGRISVMPAAVGAIGKNVLFSNGQTMVFDSVLEATGYDRKFSYLGSEWFPLASDKTYGLFKKIYPLTAQNMAFVGFTRSTGSVLVCMEIQVRHILAVFQQKISLPPFEHMINSRDIQSKDVIFGLHYYDRLMRELGCDPPIWSSWVCDPSLAWILWFRPANVLQWRIRGAGAYEWAADALKSLFL